MNREGLIAAFTDHANEVLQTQGELDATQLDEWRRHDDKLLGQLVDSFAEARAPRSFFNVRLTRPDSYFEQAFELLRTTFEPDVLGTREGYIRSLSRSEVPKNWISVGRYWTVSGNHAYDDAGQLVRFGFSPLQSTTSIAAYVEGSYMSMGAGRGMAGLGYLVTRPAIRRGKGHGTTLVEYYEAELAKLAASHHETLDLIVLESEPAARPFWYRKGYRWPQGSVYLQPPMDIDLDTGEAKSKAVPELLMVKDPNNPTAATVNRARVLEVIHFLYERWYVAECNNTAATERHRQDVLVSLFGQVEKSLPMDRPEVALVEPPIG